MDREALPKRHRELYRQRREPHRQHRERETPEERNARRKGSEIISKERALQTTCVSRITCPQPSSPMRACIPRPAPPMPPASV